MIIIGVTGNSGAGKSTVSTIIKNNTGAFVVDADQILKTMRQPGEDYFNEIVNIFGEEILYTKSKKKGKIDLAKFSNILFRNREKRDKLNKITFKYVNKKVKPLLVENKNKDFIILDFPLLYEGGYDKICNYVIGVISDNETKLSRIKERDRINKEQVQARIDTQINDEELKEKADFIINNSKDIKYINLVKEVIKVIHKIKKNEEEKKKNESIGF